MTFVWNKYDLTPHWLYIACEELHSERLKYWSNQYEEKKQALMEQHAIEMKNYKEKKFKGYKELECVFYSLQSENEAQSSEKEKNHQHKVDDVKSKVRTLA